MNVLYRKFRNMITAPQQLEAKMQQTVKDPALAKELSLEIMALRDDSEPPLIREQDIGQLPREKERRFKAIRKKHMDAFHRVRPLLPGEALEEETCAVLAEDWREYLKGTVVVIRETSVCREIHLFPYIRFKHPDIEVLSDEGISPPEVKGEVMFGAAPVSVAPPLFGALARELGNGLVKAATGLSAGPLFEKLFPPGPPNWVTELYKEIRNIVRSEIEQARIGEMQGMLRECSEHVRDFNMFKASKVPFAKCGDHLKDAYKLAVHVQTQLEQIGDAAVNIYCISSGQRFLIMQELAFNDPDHPRRPLDSPWSALIKKTAEKSVECGEKLFKSILQTRLNAITQIDGLAMPPYAHWKYWFNDTVTGEHFTSQGHARCFTADDEREIRWNNISQQRTAHCQKVEQEMRNNLSGVSESIEAWKQLAGYPLPRPK